MKYAIRIYDRAAKLSVRPGESIRNVAIRYAMEQAAVEHLHPMGEPHVERIDDGPSYGPGWLVSWARMEKNGIDADV